MRHRFAAIGPAQRADTCYCVGVGVGIGWSGCTYLRRGSLCCGGLRGAREIMRLI